jgi:organic radical activating enzyme
MKIAVNEIYYSFQGEGPTAGQPATFLRLAGCNLHCSFCDTPFAWNFGTDVECRHGTRTFDSRKESHVEEVGVIAEKIIASMERFGFMRLVITGGEPLLQQAAILELIDIIVKRNVGGHFPVEIETNGTIAPDANLALFVERFNVSPKLASSGNDQSSRLKPDALRVFAEKKSCFKFVISSLTALADVREVDALVKGYELTNIWLMPEGTTKEEQIMRSAAVYRYAKTRGWNFSPRLHVLAFGPKRGV